LLVAAQVEEAHFLFKKKKKKYELRLGHTNFGASTVIFS
jgi:hypothetical protein